MRAIIKFRVASDMQRWLKRNRESNLRFIDAGKILYLFKKLPISIIKQVRYVIFVPPEKDTELLWEGEYEDLQIAPTTNPETMMRMVAYVLSSIVSNTMWGTEVYKAYLGVIDRETPLIKTDDKYEDFRQHFALFLIDKRKLRIKSIRLRHILDVYEEVWRGARGNEKVY